MIGTATDDPWTTAPTLSGDHVVLRPTVAADADALAAACDDPDTLRWFPYGVDSAPPSATTVAHALATPGRLMLTQVDARSGIVVGTTSLYALSALHGRASVGYTWLSSAARGTAVNVEAKLLLAGHVFGTLRARRLEFTVDDRNVRSRAAVRALGATEEGVLRRHARRRDGTWRDTVVHSIVDDEWPEVHRRLLGRLATRTGAGPVI